MFHYKSVPFPDHPAPQRDHTASRKCTAQKRHPKPDHFQCTGQIFHIQCGDLHPRASAYTDPPVDRAGHSHRMSLLYLSDRNRIFIHLVAVRIIADQIPDCGNPHFPEYLLRFLPDSFQNTYFGIFIYHSSILTLPTIHSNRSAVRRCAYPHRHPDTDLRSPPPDAPHLLPAHLLHNTG